MSAKKKQKKKHLNTDLDIDYHGNNLNVTAVKHLGLPYR